MKLSLIDQMQQSAKIQPAVSTQVVPSSQAVAEKNEDVKSDKKILLTDKTKKKLPYVAGAVVLAGLGVVVLRNKFGSTNNIVRKTEGLAGKLEETTETVASKAEEVVEKVEAVSEKIVEKAEEVVEKVVEKVSSKAEKTVEEVAATAGKVAEEAVPNAEKAAEKVATVTGKAAEEVAPAAEKATVAVEETAKKAEIDLSKIAEEVEMEVDKKAQIEALEKAVADGKLVKATGGPTSYVKIAEAYVTPEEKDLVDINNVMIKTVTKISTEDNGDVYKLHDALYNIDDISVSYADDMNRPHRFHHAALLLEEAAINLFCKPKNATTMSELARSKNAENIVYTGLDKALERLLGRDILLKHYSEMPEETAVTRINLLYRFRLSPNEGKFATADGEMTGLEFKEKLLQAYRDYIRKSE